MSNKNSKAQLSARPNGERPGQAHRPMKPKTADALGYAILLPSCIDKIKHSIDSGHFSDRILPLATSSPDVVSGAIFKALEGKIVVVKDETTLKTFTIGTPEGFGGPLIDFLSCIAAVGHMNILNSEDLRPKLIGANLVGSNEIDVIDDVFRILEYANYLVLIEGSDERLTTSTISLIDIRAFANAISRDGYVSNPNVRFGVLPCPIFRPAIDAGLEIVSKALFELKHQPQTSQN